MTKKILITGGTGFIGSALTKALLKKGNTISVFDNDSRGKVTRLSEIEKEIRFIKGDIRDANAVIKACEKQDMVIHLAYINGTEYFYTKPELILEVGVKGMMNVLDGCLKHSVTEIFLASSSEVYNQPTIIPTPENVPLIVPDPKNPRFSYGGGKIISELLLLNYGRKYFKRSIVFRPHNVYGPDMGNEHVVPQFINRMNTLQKKLGDSFDFPIQGSGKETRAYIHIDDFTKALELLIKKGKHNEIYNIGTLEEITVKKLALEISSILGYKINLQPGDILPGSTTRRCADIAKITNIGFKQSVSLSAGLKKTIPWYIKYGQTNQNKV